VGLVTLAHCGRSALG